MNVVNQLCVCFVGLLCRRMASIQGLQNFEGEGTASGWSRVKMRCKGRMSSKARPGKGRIGGGKKH